MWMYRQIDRQIDRQIYEVVFMVLKKIIVSLKQQQNEIHSIISFMEIKIYI